MNLLELTLPALADNLALDEALLLDAEAGGPETLRFWEWPRPAVILGAGGKRADETHADMCERDGVPIVRRSSGGGAVVLGSGCLNYSLVLAYDRDPALGDLHASYCFILGKLADALAPLVPGIGCAGISDLAAGGRKCAGNAQQRKRTHLLHHGTLLCSFDVNLIPRYLAHPPREPDYRRQRSHLDFVANVNVPLAEVQRRLAKAWQANSVASSWPEALVDKLKGEKYGRSDWHERR
ncbi:MAG: lipoate--protein ligase family protein [Gemmataceae bacterium]|nr:lipoate--protein ligase family protein [Gemmataceae bacterium]